MINSTPTTNRLIHEKSPYLLQHAHNPVDWYPWGDEAFEKAAREDKPVFLSIGYSTCHWCHVMERESFEDEEVARVLNSDYVPIKVDREERPDVDHIYMSACLASTGSGGWPLSVFLTPGRKPFYAGTYFPKNDLYGRVGFLSLLAQIQKMWSTRRAELLQSSDKLTSRLGAPEPGKGRLDPGLVGRAAEALLYSYDEKYGGFGHAPKFPSPHNLLFLLRPANDKEKSAAAVAGTLRAMAAGGIRDHIGGGFCRYSTDRLWMVPHFEKMLYDNALLCMAYAEGYSATGDESFRRVTEETVAFVQREMTASDGGFYTAQDADSEGEEGRFYLWTPGEASAVLGEDAGRFCKLYDITTSGNFEGRSIPNRIGKTFSAEDEQFARLCMPRLYRARLRRPRPLLDDKILLSNNGLMIAALSLCGRLYCRDDWTAMAERAARFVLERMRPDGRLAAAFRDGTAYGRAALEGYSFFLWGLLELYRASLTPRYLISARELCSEMLRLFSDGSLLYDTGSDVRDLPVRGLSLYDGATPSGFSAAVHSLAVLSRFTGDVGLRDRAVSLLDAVSAEVSENPAGYTHLLFAAELIRRGGTDVVLYAGEGLGELLEATRRISPYDTRVLCGKGYEQISSAAPYTKDMSQKDSRATAYVCRDGACSGLTGAEELRELLSN